LEDFKELSVEESSTLLFGGQEDNIGKQLHEFMKSKLFTVERFSDSIFRSVLA
jgi:hypothetical protein